jgi:hypothetical protein
MAALGEPMVGRTIGGRVVLVEPDVTPRRHVHRDHDEPDAAADDDQMTRSRIDVSDVTAAATWSS